jgi:hypothetical protein
LISSSPSSSTAALPSILSTTAFINSRLLSHGRNYGPRFAVATL